MKVNLFVLGSVLGLSAACSTVSPIAHAEVIRVRLPPPLPRLVGDTWQFHSQIQDKKPGQFKDKKAVEAYFNPLYIALKRRNPVADARAAAEKGQRLLLGMYYNPNGVLSTNGRVWNLYNPVDFKDDASYRRCRGGGLKRLEGTSNILDCKDVQSCGQYRNFVESYIYRFNNVMVTYCNKPPQKK